MCVTKFVKDSARLRTVVAKFQSLRNNLHDVVYKCNKKPNNMLNSHYLGIGCVMIPVCVSEYLTPNISQQSCRSKKHS